MSAQKEIFSGPVSLCVVAGSGGEMGIHPRHAPLMTTLRPGPIRLVLPDGEEVFIFVGGGILEVMPHMITVLADTAIRADDLDAAAAISARDEAARQLRDRTSVMEFTEAQAKLAKAMMELQELESLRKKMKR